MCRDINAIQEEPIMKNQRIISAIVSAALLVSSAAAAVYTSAADTTLPEDKITGNLAAALETNNDGDIFPIIVHIRDDIDREALKAKAEADTEAYIQSIDTEGMTEEEINDLRSNYCEDLYLTYLIEEVNKNRAPLSKYRIDWESADGYSWENTVAGNASPEAIAELAKEDIVASIELTGDLPIPVTTEAVEPATSGCDENMSPELRRFAFSGTGSQVVSIWLSDPTSSLYADAAEYADKEMEKIGQYMSNEDMYRDYYNFLIRSYEQEHSAEAGRQMIGAFAKKYGLTVISQNDSVGRLTAEVTAEQLKIMMTDSDVSWAVSGETVEEPTEGPTQPILAPPPGEYDEPVKLIQPIVLCDELREFINSGEGTRYVIITLTEFSDSIIDDAAEAYADKEMENIGEYMSNEAMYNQYRSLLVQNYLKEHKGDKVEDIVYCFEQKYGITVRSLDTDNTRIIAAVTPEALKSMLNDENVLAVTPYETINEPTEGPTYPTISAPVITIGSKKPGDANLDGKITVADAVTVLQFLANQEKYSLTEEAILNADIDGITGLSGGDAITIQRMDAGIVPKVDENT